VARRQPWREIADGEAIAFVLRHRLAPESAGIAAGTGCMFVGISHAIGGHALPLYMGVLTGSLAFALATAALGGFAKVFVRMDKNVLSVTGGRPKKPLVRIPVLDIDRFCQREHDVGGGWAILAVTGNGKRESLCVTLGRGADAAAFVARLDECLRTLRTPEHYRS